MKSDLLTWLAGSGTWAWHTALTLFVVLNGIAVAVVVVTRDRSLVDRWTSRWLGANLTLLGFGVGAPLLSSTLQLVISALPDIGQVTSALPK